MSDYPALDDMTVLDLVMLRHKVAKSQEPTDIEFKKAIDKRLKEQPKEVE